MHIAAATSIGDHLRRAIRVDCYLEEETPLPPELPESIRIVNKSDPRGIRPRMDLRAERVGNPFGDIAETQKLWGGNAPDCISSPKSKLRTSPI